MTHASKRPFILMELIIALILVGTILTLLIQFFSNSLRMDQKMDALRKELYSRQHFQIRMSHVFTSITPRSNLPPSSGSSFYTLEDKTPSLIAIFDNGIDPDPSFSGAVQGKIQIDSDGNLALFLQPLGLEPPHLLRKEILLYNVQDLEFQFLAKQSSDNSSFAWKKAWPKTRWDIPSLIRMTANQKGKELAFAFSLPFADPITYERKKT